MDRLFIWLMALLITVATGGCGGESVSTNFIDSGVNISADSGDLELSAGYTIDFASYHPPSFNTVAEVDQETIEADAKPIDFVKGNWVALVLGLMGFTEVVVRLTPSKKDDAAFLWVRKLFDFLIPNLKKGGGQHQLE